MKSNKPIGPLLLALAVGLIAVANHAARDGESERSPATVLSDPTARMLETIRVKHGFPALAAAVVVDGEIVVTNAVGFRRHGGTETVTVHERFHIGSVTKSMTATVAALLVEQGKISWTTTIGESFGDFVDHVRTIKAIDPDRIVTNSPGYAGELGSFQENRALDYLSPHTTRASDRPWEVAHLEIAMPLNR